MEATFGDKIRNGSFFSIRCGHMARHSLKRVAAILLIVLLTILDAVFTLELVSHGAAEMNPIMCYYLNQGPVVFFGVKYMLTCGSLLLVLALNDACGIKAKIPVKTFLAFQVIALGLVVQWEAYLMLFVI